jgi:uncharacterized membrane protein
VRTEASASARNLHYRPLFTTLAILAMSLLGFLDSLYLAVAHYRDSVPTCTVIRGCETVLTSRFSSVLGVPVALMGVVFFVVAFYSAIATVTHAGQRTFVWMRAVAYVGVAVSLFFFLVQALVIHVYCQYCLASEVLVVGIFVLSLLLPRPAAQSRDSPGG